MKTVFVTCMMFGPETPMFSFASFAINCISNCLLRDYSDLLAPAGLLNPKSKTFF